MWLLRVTWFVSFVAMPGICCFLHVLHDAIHHINHTGRHLCVFPVPSRCQAFGAFSV